MIERFRWWLFGGKRDLQDGRHGMEMSPPAWERFYNRYIWPIFRARTNKRLQATAGANAEKSEAPARRATDAHVGRLIMNLHGMFWTNEKGIITLWYPDGDFCAEVHDNLGLGIAAQEVAEFICKAAQETHAVDAASAPRG